MNTNVTHQQIQSYQKNGYLVIDDFLTDDELEYWREAVDEATEERRKKKLDGTAAGGKETFYGNVFLQLMLLSRTNEKVRGRMHDPELAKRGALVLASLLAGAAAWQVKRRKLLPA